MKHSLNFNALMNDGDASLFSLAFHRYRLHIFWNDIRGTAAPAAKCHQSSKISPTSVKYVLKNSTEIIKEYTFAEASVDKRSDQVINTADRSHGGQE